MAKIGALGEFPLQWERSLCLVGALDAKRVAGPAQESQIIASISLVLPNVRDSMG